VNISNSPEILSKVDDKVTISTSVNTKFLELSTENIEIYLVNSIVHELKFIAQEKNLNSSRVLTATFSGVEAGSYELKVFIKDIGGARITNRTNLFRLETTNTNLVTTNDMKSSFLGGRIFKINSDNLTTNS